MISQLASEGPLALPLALDEPIALQARAANVSSDEQSSSQEPSFCINSVVRTAMACFLCCCTAGVMVIFLQGLLNRTSNSQKPVELQLSQKNVPQESVELQVSQPDHPQKTLDVQLSWLDHYANRPTIAVQSEANQPSR